MPISILVLAIANYHCAKIAMTRKLRTLKETDKINMEEEAFHSLFHLADADNSGEGKIKKKKKKKKMKHMCLVLSYVFLFISNCI